MSNTPNIDNFEVLEVLGHGGMSTVWKARQCSLDRLVAIKVLAPRLATDATDVERFNAEARATAQLKHPGIVQVYDASLSEGSYYFVMELIDGYTVGEWVRRKGRLAEADVLVLTECVVTALDYAWTNFGMIHCDIKPDNVMIDADGSVKITDLGLSRTLSSLVIDNSGEVMGTPAYMSPEQVSGASDLDCRTDIYSLGAMLYHLVTGHLLFEGESEDRQMVLQIEGHVPDPAAYCPDLHPAVCTLIARMLTKDRDCRYEDWKAVALDLQRAKRRLPLRAQSRVGTSTVKRNHKRLRVHAPKSTRGVSTQNGKGSARRPASIKPASRTIRRRPALLPILLIVGLAIMLGWLIVNRDRISRSSFRDPQTFNYDAPGILPETADEALERVSRQALREALDWADRNPGEINTIVARYRAVSALYPGTEAARLAREAEKTILDARRQESVEGAMSETGAAE